MNFFFFHFLAEGRGDLSFLTWFIEVLILNRFDHFFTKKYLQHTHRKSISQCFLYKSCEQFSPHDSFFLLTAMFTFSFGTCRLWSITFPEYILTGIKILNGRERFLRLGVCTLQSIIRCVLSTWGVVMNELRCCNNYSISVLKGWVFGTLVQILCGF